MPALPKSWLKAKPTKKIPHRGIGLFLDGSVCVVIETLWPLWVNNKFSLINSTLYPAHIIPRQCEAGLYYFTWELFAGTHWRRNVFVKDIVSGKMETIVYYLQWERRRLGLTESLGSHWNVRFPLSNLYDDFFFLSQAVWTQRKWISENAGVWRTHRGLKRFASLAELKILDADSPSVSGTVQTVICYLLIPPHFVLWNRFIHSFCKYLWSGWYVLGTILAAPLWWQVLTNPTARRCWNTRTGNSIGREVQDGTAGPGGGTRAGGFLRASRAGSGVLRSAG